MPEEILAKSESNDGTADEQSSTTVKVNNGHVTYRANNMREADSTTPTKKDATSRKLFEGRSRRRRLHPEFCLDRFISEELPMTKLERCPKLSEEELLARLQAFRRDHRMDNSRHTPSPSEPHQFANTALSEEETESSREAEMFMSNQINTVNVPLKATAYSRKVTRAWLE